MKYGILTRIISVENNFRLQMKLQRILLNNHSKAIHFRKDFIKETAIVYYPARRTHWDKHWKP